MPPYVGSVQVNDAGQAEVVPTRDPLYVVLGVVLSYARETLQPRSGADVSDRGCIMGGVQSPWRRGLRPFTMK